MASLPSAILILCKWKHTCIMGKVCNIPGTYIVFDFLLNLFCHFPRCPNYLIFSNAYSPAKLAPVHMNAFILLIFLMYASISA